MLFLPKLGKAGKDKCSENIFTVAEKQGKYLHEINTTQGSVSSFKNDLKNTSAENDLELFRVKPEI